MTTFAATVLRHAARECLAPYASTLDGGPPFPTIAGGRVYTDRNDYIDDLSDATPDKPLPTVEIYTPVRDGRERGPSQSSAEADWTIELHLLLTMAVVDEEGGEYSVMAAHSTPEAEANLEFLGWQIRDLFTGTRDGNVAFRSIVKRITRITGHGFYMPQMQLALAQHEMVMTCLCDDSIRPDAGGLSSRVEQVRQLLPAGSDGRRYLDQIATLVDPVNRTALAGVRIGADFGEGIPSDVTQAPLQGGPDFEETP